MLMSDGKLWLNLHSRNHQGFVCIYVHKEPLHWVRMLLTNDALGCVAALLSRFGWQQAEWPNTNRVEPFDQGKHIQHLLRMLLDHACMQCVKADACCSWMTEAVI